MASRFDPSRVRKQAGAFLVDNFFRVLAGVGKWHPSADPRRHGVEVLSDIAYRPTRQREHHLDIYRPLDLSTLPPEGAARAGHRRRVSGPPWPVVLYVHGGGFRILSKDTHWIMGLAFARRGYLVFNISYRLAPTHPYPAAVEDAAAAYRWVVEHAAEYGGDPTRLVVAGESAGANLATSLAIAASYRREEPFARDVFDTGVVPRAVVAACGILQVSDTERLHRRRPLPSWLRDRLEEVEESYLEQTARSLVEGAPPQHDLADPLLVLERGAAPDRPLPPFFAPVGTKDPLLDDTRRLATALERLGVPCDARYYPGEVHAFHAMIFREQARQCWRDCYDFLAEHVERRPSPVATPE